MFSQNRSNIHSLSDYTVAVIVNKDEGRLGPSETFLHAHIDGLPCKVLALIGNPGYRRLQGEKGKGVPSRSIIPLGLRWICRNMGLSTPRDQDTHAVSHFLRAQGVNAVLAEYGPTAISVMDACVKSSVPLIAHFHGFDAYRKDLLEMHAADYQRLIQQAAAIVAVSKHMRSQLMMLGAKPEKTFHNSCGAEIPKGVLSCPDQAGPLFVMVGRLTEKKAPFLSLMAFAKVSGSFPDARLEIIGDGPLRNACEQLATALKIHDRVIFQGARPHSDVLDAMARARCFIQHSVCAPDGDHEGTPVAVLEAMGMGLPVVATRHGGIVDVIEEGVTGSLIDEYDVDGMAAAMCEYAVDPSTAQQVGTRARSAVLDYWTSEKSIGRLWDIIRQTIVRPTSNVSSQDTKILQN